MAINVPDMQSAVDYFGRVLGGVEIFRTGEFAADAEMISQFKLRPGTLIRDHRMIAIGNQAQISLFQYFHQDICWVQPNSSDQGGYHLAFQVKDMRRARLHLESLGIAPAGEPFEFEGGPNDGIVSMYFYSPWGLQIEFVEYPKLMNRVCRDSD